MGSRATDSKPTPGRRAGPPKWASTGRFTVSYSYWAAIAPHPRGYHPPEVPTGPGDGGRDPAPARPEPELQAGSGEIESVTKRLDLSLAAGDARLEQRHTPASAAASPDPAAGPEEDLSG
jgi:hypothetical protein